jgi:hypothetical protein
VNPIERLRRETFVVRLWREPTNGAWRGRIVHLASRESAYFATLAQVETFIRRFADGIEKQTLTMEETDDESKDPA